MSRASVGRGNPCCAIICGRKHEPVDRVARHQWCLVWGVNVRQCVKVGHCFCKTDKRAQLLNSVGLLNGGLGSCTEMFVTSSHDENELTFIKVEVVTDSIEEDDPEPMTSAGVRTEPENSVDLPNVELGSCTGMFVTSSRDENELTFIKVEEVTDRTEEEELEPKTSAGVRTEPENCVDLPNGERGSCREKFVTSTHDTNELAFIKVEELTDGTEEEDPEAVTAVVIRTEPENCVVSVKGEPGLCSETFITPSNDETEEVNTKVEEVIYIKEEGVPEAIACPLIETEPEGTPNEQLHVHGAERRYCCEVCNKVFGYRSVLIRHLHLHRGERPYSCGLCNKAFSERSNLIIHERIHSGERPYSCDVCSKAFSQQNNLIRHQRVHSGERPYFCDVCNKSFSQQNSLMTHKRIHSGERPYCCYVCNRAFSEQSNLIKHARIHSGERPFCCEVCHKAFSQQSSLMAHRRIHSGERPYSCEVCKKAFTERSNLIIHRRVHSGERPYSCEVCNRAFSQQSSLMAHKRIHSGERPYSCDVCSKTFSHQTNLIRHQRLRSGEHPYCCDVCNKTFSQESNLLKHQRLHSGEHPYSCDLCNKAFSQQSSLIRHQRLHSGEHK